MDKLSLSKTAKLEKRENNILQRNGKLGVSEDEKKTLESKVVRAGFEGKKVGFLNKNLQKQGGMSKREGNKFS